VKRWCSGSSNLESVSSAAVDGGAERHEYRNRTDSSNVAAVRSLVASVASVVV